MAPTAEIDTIHCTRNERLEVDITHHPDGMVEIEMCDAHDWNGALRAVIPLEVLRAALRRADETDPQKGYNIQIDEPKPDVLIVHGQTPSPTRRYPV